MASFAFRNPHPTPPSKKKEKQKRKIEIKDKRENPKNKHNEKTSQRPEKVKVELLKSEWVAFLYVSGLNWFSSREESLNYDGE